MSSDGMIELYREREIDDSVKPLKQLQKMKQWHILRKYVSLYLFPRSDASSWLSLFPSKLNI